MTRASIPVMLVLSLLAGPALAGTLPLPVSTDFEGLTSAPGEELVIGAVGEAARFSGDAFTGSVGNFTLYHSGFFAWMVETGGTGSVVFDSGASDVRLWATANANADAALSVEALDRAGAVIASETLQPGDGFRELTFVGDIGSIRFDNPSSVASSYASIDDFSFAPAQVPEPALALLLGVAAAGVALHRRST